MFPHKRDNLNTATPATDRPASPDKRSCHSMIGRLLLLLAGVVLAGTSLAAPVTVPNGDFSSSANNGTVGGGLIGGSGTNVTIGSGPWLGTYHGVLGLLAPPVLTIGSGSATISGLAGLNALGIVNNDGYFSQTLSTNYVHDHHYVLSADIDVGGVLDVSALQGNSGIGIALINGSTVVASTQTATSGNVAISLLSGTTYRVSLAYDTGTPANGNIGVRLFAQPQNLVTADLLTSVRFDNVTLTASALNPIPASIAPVANSGGTPQGTTVNTDFPKPFSVVVLDSEGDPVSGATVTFTPPASGASVVLSSTTAITDINGVAQVTGTANSQAGNYTLHATVSGVVAPANFDLTNIAGAAANLSGATGTPQSATVNTDYTDPLGVTVTDAEDNPVEGVTVTFTAPGSGASATFPSGNTAITDSSGHAQVNVKANIVAGEYMVTASVSGTASTTSYDLTNTAGPATQAVPAQGTPQSAEVSTDFGDPLVVTIEDAYGNPVAGEDVTFMAPDDSGGDPSANIYECPSGSPSHTVHETTDSNGNATVCATADGNAGGPYDITVSDDNTPSANTVFSLTNTAGTINGTPGGGGGQNAVVNAAFKCALELYVTDGTDSPKSGVNIAFVAPDSGASATLSNGVDNGTNVVVTTDNSGYASVTATANGIAGSFVVSAGVEGSGVTLATYPMTNLAAGDPIFANGFEIEPYCPSAP